ncbi:MAG: nitroreductase [Thermomicrobiales bacterium]|nr:nitroreductase [Thermomicrobiales bacterium]
MSVMDAIRGRRSIGKVLPDVPPREVIETILEAGTWAPCHHVTEPWKFTVIAGDARDSLGDVMARAKVERMIRQGKPTDGEYERAKAKATRAPVIIAVAVEPVVGPKVVEIEEVEAGAAAVQNMLLAAHSFGLGTIWRTGDPAYDTEVKRFLGLAAEAHIIGFIYLGYPAVSPNRARHTPHHALTSWLGWEEHERPDFLTSDVTSL